MSRISWRCFGSCIFSRHRIVEAPENDTHVWFSWSVNRYRIIKLHTYSLSFVPAPSGNRNHYRSPTNLWYP
uniref:Uncharacterized protein n=1 Tax=Aegilops tauschii subsp. strangulata TaxID=200361 RepID=A0A453S752_AEGTS